MNLSRSALGATLCVLALWAPGCGGDDNGYPDEARRNFLRECERQPNVTPGGCKCTFEEIERTVPYDEFKRADEALRNDRALDRATARKFRDAVNHCLNVR